MLVVVLVSAMLIGVLCTPVPSQNHTGTHMDLSVLQTHATTQQFEGSDSNLKLEGKLSKTVDYVIGKNIKSILLKEDIKFDADFNRTHEKIHSPKQANCTVPVMCDQINRHACFATNNTCGTCLSGYSGAFGDSNEPCLPVDCSKAPACEELNRGRCRDIPNTCGPCFEDFRVPGTAWLPFEMNIESSNTPCMALNYRPVIIVHGLGDSFNGYLMRYLRSTTQRTFHVLKTFSAEPAGGTFSLTTPLSQMVDELAEQIKAIPSAQNGFNLVGVSQGGLVARAYIEKYNNPPVYNFVSLHSPMAGIFECPGNKLSAVPCQVGVWYDVVSPHDYWRGADHNGVFSKATYLSWNNFLQKINNEGPVINATYRENMVSLHHYVLIKADRDSVVSPAESSWHGYVDWNDTTHILTMEETEEYKNDVLGLKTLAEQNKLVKLRTPGGHVEVQSDYWERHVNPFFDNGWYQDGKEFDLQDHLTAVFASAAASSS